MKPESASAAAAGVDDYVASIEPARRRAASCSKQARSPAGVVEIHGAAPDRGLDVDPGVLRRRRRIRRPTGRAGRDEFEMPLSRAAVAHDVPLLRDLPRRPGAERRRRRDAGAGHPDARSTTDLPHSIDIPKDHAGARCRGRARHARSRRSSATQSPIGDVRGQQPPPPVGRQLAHVFVVSAASPDGVIEAIERPGGGVLRRRAVAPGELLGTGEFRRCSGHSSTPPNNGGRRRTDPRRNNEAVNE